VELWNHLCQVTKILFKEHVSIVVLLDLRNQRIRLSTMCTVLITVSRVTGLKKSVEGPKSVIETLDTQNERID